MIEVEDTMDELVSRSLARRYRPSNDLQYDSYGIHDLQLDYLKETQTAVPGDTALRDMHKVSIRILICGAPISIERARFPFGIFR